MSKIIRQLGLSSETFLAPAGCRVVKTAPVPILVCITQLKNCGHGLYLHLPTCYLKAVPISD
jgi:hypothetical protein